MYRKSTLYLVAAFLIVESIAIVALPSRMPRPWRVTTGAINTLAALTLIVLARQRPD